MTDSPDEDDEVGLIAFNAEGHITMDGESLNELCEALEAALIKSNVSVLRGTIAMLWVMTSQGAATDFEHAGPGKWLRLPQQLMGWMYEEAFRNCVAIAAMEAHGAADGDPGSVH